jgi:hypothetical protein
MVSATVIMVLIMRPDSLMDSCCESYNTSFDEEIFLG